MWSFKIGHATLQVMLMVLMVCSAPVCKVPKTCTMILQNIEATVDTLLKEKWKNITVVKPILDLHKCPKNFFCLAEKVAESAREENVETNKLSTLTTNFKHYNTNCTTTCTLIKGHRYHLHAFLTEVKKCVEEFLYSKKQKKKMNNTDC